MAKPSHLPQIDFSDLHPTSRGAGKWDSVRAEVMEAVVTTGCFEAYYPSMGPELRAGLFAEAVRPLFSLPLDAKLRNSVGPEKYFDGYLGRLPALDRYESLAIVDGSKPEAIQAFARLMWPEGKPGFSETVHSAAKHMAELEDMVRRMVLESFGLSKYHEAQNKSTWHLFRFSEYRAAEAEEKKLGYLSHQDTNILSIICQHEVDGLEVQTRDGEWILVKPSPTSLIVLVGNAFRAWMNDRVYAPFHRVTVGGEGTRYSAILFSVIPGTIQAPEELVDKDHPARFKPYDYDEYVTFSVSEEGARHEDRLTAFSGVSADAAVDA